MLSFDNAAAIAAAPSTASLDAELKRLLTERVGDWTTTDLLGLTHLLIVEASDTEEAILEEVGFSPLVNSLDERRFGDSGFEPSWDWLEHHNGWFELIFTIGNDGFAFVVFIQGAEAADDDLLALCRLYAPRVRTQTQEGN